MVDRSVAMAGDARGRFRRNHVIPRDYNTLCTEFDRSVAQIVVAAGVPSNGNEITKCSKVR